MCTALIRVGKRYISPNIELDPVNVYFSMTDFIIMKASTSPLLKKYFKM